MKIAVITALLFLLALVVNGLLVLSLVIPFEWFWNAALPTIFSAPWVNFHQSIGFLGLIFIARWVPTGTKFQAQLHDS